ncbi:MAG: HIT domain-containing protein [Candidatus Nomurabacteria bacterium]|nr:HIT domain-containing protein [Candidatus Nomurabacteria bacterium]
MSEYDAKTKEGKCIFCEIVAGRFPVAGKFWENNEFMAFLSIDPNTEGFSCVIPKEHYASDILKMPDDVLQRYIVAAKETAFVLEKYFEDVGRVGLMMEGTGIDHAHIKLMPLHGTENLKNGNWQQFLSGKEFWFEKYEGWICSGSGPKADLEKLKILAEGIKKVS